jgi:PLP dependent protein
VTIAERWEQVRSKVAVACERAGRASHEVTIVAVSKTHPASAVREAMAAGASDFGENYAQELAGKLGEVEGAIRWHFIGRLQSNKAKLVAGKVVLVHAVETESLAQELGKRAGAVQPILLAVNLGGEATKGGVTAVAAVAIARTLVATPNVRLDGLMTMPPPSEDPEASRPIFDGLHALRDRLRDELGQPLPVLSMGMSGDYEVAIACGATHVRIGTAIFGSRPAA